MHPIQSGSISLILASAAFVGLVHSLAPGHWLPVVLMAKTKRWNLSTSLMGAFIGGLGHILISALLGCLAMWIEVSLLAEHENVIERWAGALLALFGLGYALLAFQRHKACHGHTHHGPQPSQKLRKTPFLFLFTIGFSPCVAVLPVFAAAATMGFGVMALSLLAFSVGVLTALMGSTWIVTRGLMKLDHPFFEHYGDVITGLGVAVMGIVLVLIHHSH